MRRRYLLPFATFVFIIVTLGFLFHFYSANQVKRELELKRTSQVLRIFLDGFARSISTGYFQWDDFYEALTSNREDFIGENLGYIKRDFPYVKDAKIVERLSWFTEEGLYQFKVEDNRIFIYFNVWDSKVERVIEDRVAFVEVDLLSLLKDLEISSFFIPDPDGDLVLEGVRVRSLIPRIKPLQIFYSTGMGILSALFIGFMLMLYSEKTTRVKLLEKISMIMEEKDPYTKNHSKNVALISLALADRLGLGDKEKKLLEEAALLHDIGKIGVSDEILNKKGKLTPQEFDIVKKHTEIAYNIFSDINGAELLAKIIRHHHERMDGSGYPDGLKGEEIPLLSRIIAVADVFDALTSDRPYRPAMSYDEAIKVMESMPLDERVFRVLKESYKEIMRIK